MHASSPARISTALALTLVAFTAGAWDLDCKHSADRTARVDQGGVERIEIAARAGDLEVRAGSPGQVYARGKACASSAEFLAETQIRTVRDGDTLRLFVQVPEKMVGVGLFYARLDLTIDVPDGIPVEVTDSSGDATITGVRLEKLTDSSGDLTLRDTDGNVEVVDSSGDLGIENDSSGDILVSDVGRDLAVLADTSGEVRVSGVKGTVRLPN